MPAINFPQSPFTAEALADWLELSALIAADHNASTGDLGSELKRLGEHGSDGLLGSVLLEIDRREKGAGKDAYPFERKNSSVELKADAKGFPAYIFCLALSYYKWKIRKDAPENPWLLFEELACFSAKNYLGGEAIIFGTSSRTGKNAIEIFASKIDELAKKLGEGECFHPQRSFSAKDSKLDIVAWKGFPDGRPSQIIIFGQCASGANWNQKLNEVIPEDFWDQWMNQGKVSAPLRSVFMPHRLFDDEEWKLCARRARLLFDRCRIVAFAHAETVNGPFADRLLNCCRTEWNLAV